MALTFAIAIAVLGPACLLGPASAFAASMPHSMDAPIRDCGDGESMVACPHEGDVVTVGITADDLRVTAALLPANAAAVHQPVELSSSLSSAVDPPTGGVPHLTPLRL